MKHYRLVPLLFLVTLRLAAVEYRGPDGISFDLPEGWSAFGEATTQSFSFSDDSTAMFMQVFRFARDNATELTSLYDLVASGLRATGDRVPFQYSGVPAVFASISFEAAGKPVVGFAVCVRTGTSDIVAITYGPEGPEYQDELLSALDSLAVSDSDLIMPGPVSQFMLSGDDETATAVIEFAGFSTRFIVDMGEFDVAQLVVEREARLLAQSTGEDHDTWKRFYRMIYRDGYSRFSQFGREFAAHFAGRDARGTAEAVLDWVQQWEYTRTGTLADLLNPYEAALRETGDCDSRGLVYSILLHYAGIESTLLISSEYSHSVSTALIPGDGAQIETEKGFQIVGETTEDVPMGMIASDQADPAGWIVVDLDGKRGPR